MDDPWTYNETIVLVTSYLLDLISYPHQQSPREYLGAWRASESYGKCRRVAGIKYTRPPGGDIINALSS